MIGGPTRLTLAGLCRQLPAALVPFGTEVVPETPISAVHINELRDPRPYLEGRELLLTTGLTLPRRGQAVREYVERLVAADAAGLALGLGPVYASIPPALARACKECGLPLFTVPDAVPFLVVTRGFWEALGQERERPLHEALDAHRRLVAAVASPNPVQAVLRVLAEAARGWAVLTDAAGTAQAVWPPERAADAGLLSAEVTRLRAAGARSSATFPLAGQDAVLHPVLTADAVVGYLATVSSEPFRSITRNVVLTALALLGLDAVHRRQREEVDGVRRAAVAHLLDVRQPAPARQVAEALGVEFPPSRVRVVVAVGRPGPRVLAALTAALPAHARRWIGAAGQDGAWLVLHPALAAPDLDVLDETLVAACPDARVAVGPVVDLGDIHAARTRLDAQLRDRVAGTALSWAGAGAPGPEPGWAIDLLEPISGYPRADLIGAVREYLRHRGHWESAARALDIHRNTVRHRIARAEALLGLDLTDPDAAARVWLALRACGRA